MRVCVQVVHQVLVTEYKGKRQKCSTFYLKEGDEEEEERNSAKGCTPSPSSTLVRQKQKLGHK